MAKNKKYSKKTSDYKLDLEEIRKSAQKLYEYEQGIKTELAPNQCPQCQDNLN